jgi:hypothetical protein
MAAKWKVDGKWMSEGRRVGAAVVIFLAVISQSLAVNSAM